MIERWGNGLPGVWSQMDRMTREMDRLLGRARSGAARVGVYPALNLFDDGESLVLRAELPGIDPDDLEIRATGRSVTIAGERRRPEVDENAGAHRLERSYGRFRRAVSLPQQIDPDRVQARYERGVLELVLPRAEEAKPRKIQVAS